MLNSNIDRISRSCVLLELFVGRISIIESFIYTVKNKETEEEPVQTTTEQVLRLSCHIDNNNNPINHLAEGLKISLEGDVEKHSEKLGRNSVWFKQSKINKIVIIYSIS